MRRRPGQESGFESLALADLVIDAGHTRNHENSGPSSHVTHRWRKADSNPQSRSEKSGRSATRHMDSWSLGRRERYQRGTGSSNPSLSKGESCANLHAGGAGPDGGESDLAQGHAGKKARLSPGTPITATKPVAPARRHGRPPTTTAKSAGSKHSSSNLGDQVLALATGKTQQEIAAACKGARANHVR